MQCKDKILAQSIITSAKTTVKDITPEMFAKELGNVVEEVKLQVLYVALPRPPSPVHEGSSLAASLSDNGNAYTAEFVNASRAFTEPQDKASETLISKLTEEKNLALQQNTKLRQELELMRREISKQSGGFSFMFVVIVCLLAVLLGYVVKR